MLFCTPAFWQFFAVVFVLYWITPWQRGRVLVLLGASFYFYAHWNPWLAVLLTASAMTDYGLARAIQATVAPRTRRLLLSLSIAGNVGLLCYFKYANFFLRSLEEAAGSCGLSVSLPVLRVILPVGISFYTFEAISYTVDVYRGRVRAVRDPCHFLLFILFFPHLVAGPIVRARHFLPQAARRKRWSWPRIHAGVLLILLGVIKKLAVADRMALYVDPVFADPAAHGTVALWLAAIAYALQVYCDFSGYTDMALGLAQLFGYHLAPNFNLPFLSANMAEFWRRWHISLSSWIRDYLYIPLGGSHGGGWRTSRNILLTMALCGLWHGANWNYVLWGVLNGVLVVAHGAFRPWCARRPALDSVLRSVPGTTLRVAGTFACFCLTLAVFRAPGVRAAGAALSRMLMPAGGEGLAVRPLGLYLTIVAVALAHILAQDDRWQRWWERVPVPVRGLGFGTALSLAMILAPQASKAFIYFQF